MESRRRVARSSKAGKRDGKSVKAQTTAEEARRTEALRVTLQQRVELEKRALQVVERLLDDSVEEDLLVDCARLITSSHYKDVVEERSIVKLCGYPLCSNKLSKVPTQQFKISTKTNKVYDITERKCFCSNYCYKASKSFELQISKSPLWLRPHESLPDIKLLKKGEGLIESSWSSGSSGKELTLVERRLREDDVENPLPLGSESSENPLDSRHSPNNAHSDDSGTEHDFVSSMVSQRQRPRVHWGDRVEVREPCEGEERERSSPQKDPTGLRQKPSSSEDVEEEADTGGPQTEMSNGLDGPQQITTALHQGSDGRSILGERGSPEGQSTEEVAELRNHVTVQDRDSATSPAPTAGVTTTAQSSVPDPAPTPTSLQDPAPPTQPGLSITQVGMSRRGAGGLRGLLTNQEATRKPVSLRQNLLEDVRRTFKEWCTDNTLKFLRGPDDVSEAQMKTKSCTVEDEELDEDDLEDIGGALPGSPRRPTAPAPDYEALCRETEQLGLRVKEFYKGTCVLPEEAQRLEEKQARDSEGEKVPVLPLIDSHSQHLIQKRIAVEKISRSLRDILGPLRLTMADVSSDLNNLVRTFRLTNTNIIHKPPEWTLITMVLLHLLSQVSLVVRQTLDSPASVEYVSALMQELQLQDQDLQSLLQLLKTPRHSQNV
ncbi:hypothetical protein DPEC_G00057470 [Dallia pectoralis]|uniref:Uncharacterized protein n=1 Tax=Dallia pectoralis TaxID=75939 RepID=A0ACC2H664_DALPE|nr:hypothetical protein DPEC_G00057470 [Dallia pectoralis]